MQHTALRIKVPPTLKVYLLTDKNLGDSPIPRITRPSNLAQPTGASKVADKQYAVTFDPGTAGETVDLVLSSVQVGFFRSLLAIFTLTFWLSLLPGKDFFTNFSLKTFIFRSFALSGVVVFILIGLELAGVSIHKPFSRWLNTLEMAERAGDKIESLFSEPDPFFKSEEAVKFYERTGHRLEKMYTMTAVVYEDVTEKMLIRKAYFAADHLDAAEDICEKELGGKIPPMADYTLWMKSDNVRGELNLAFAEWTSTSRGFISDDYELFISPENIATLQMNMAEIKASAGETLTELAKNYDLERGGLGDDDLKIKLVEFLYKQLNMPAGTDIVYDEGKTRFFLDAENESKFRCVRRLPAQ